jgi:hypothetical protein
MWHAIRDIIVASINKGQFLVAILGGVLLVTAWRMPAEQLPELAKRTLELLVKGKLLGWALFVVVSAAWAILGQVGRNAHRKEVKRIGAEKSKAQSRVQGKDVKSSNKSA